LRLQFWLMPDDDLGAQRDALVKVGNVGVDQPETAGRNRGADGVGCGKTAPNNLAVVTGWFLLEIRAIRLGNGSMKV
jgi:hypothetical protein